MAPEMNTHAVENLSQKTQRTHAKNAKSRLTTSGYEHQHASTSCSEIRAIYHPNPTPDRWPLESLPLGSETGIQVSAVVGIGDHLGRQLPVSLLVPVSVASVDTTQPWHGKMDWDIDTAGVISAFIMRHLRNQDLVIWTGVKSIQEV